MTCWFIIFKSIIIFIIYRLYLVNAGTPSCPLIFIIVLHTSFRMILKMVHHILNFALFTVIIMTFDFVLLMVRYALDYINFCVCNFQFFYTFILLFYYYNIPVCCIIDFASSVILSNLLCCFHISTNPQILKTADN